MSIFIFITYLNIILQEPGPAMAGTVICDRKLSCRIFILKEVLP